MGLVSHYTKTMKELPQKAKFYLNHEKEEVKKTYLKYKYLKSKIKKGEASTKDLLDFRSHRATLLQIPVHAALIGVVPGGIAASAIIAKAKGSISGTPEKNEKLLNKLRVGDKLTYLEKRRLRKADALEKVNNNLLAQRLTKKIIKRNP